MKRVTSIFVATVIMCSVLMNSIYAAAVTTAKFKDIKDSDWFAEEVGRMNTLGIIDGMPGGIFKPKGEVTRAQFVKMLVQAMGYQKIDSISFDDIKPLPTRKAHWSSVYVETALRNDVISKDELGTNFYPDVPVRRADMMIMMYKALKLSPSTGDNPFADIAEASGVFTKLFEEYLVRGTIEGGKRLFKAEGLTTRAEAAVIITRLVEYKANPSEYVKKSAMAERFASGTQTAEDIASKRASEIAKAKADPNYIMEPEIRVINELNDFAGYGVDAKETFDGIAGHIALDNFSDYLKYTPECQFKIVCTSKTKDLVNTTTRLVQPFISYDHRYEIRTDIWKPTKEVSTLNKEMSAYSIKAITRDEQKVVNGKWVGVPEYIIKGEILNFTLSIKRGSNVKEFEIAFKVN